MRKFFFPVTYTLYFTLPFNTIFMFNFEFQENEAHR